MRAAVPSDARHAGLRDAIIRHPSLELVDIEVDVESGRTPTGAVSADPAADPNDLNHLADVVFAIDEVEVAGHRDVRRYTTRAEVSPGQVVAARHLLTASSGMPSIVAPLPIDPPEPLESRGDIASISVVGSRSAEVVDEARRRGIDLAEPTLGGAGRIVVIAEEGPGDLHSVRSQMASEAAVVAASANAAANDSIGHGSTGLLAGAGELLDVAVELSASPTECARLGFEARADVAAATWGRVLRGLLVTDRRPHDPAALRGLGGVAARSQWRSRLALAAGWADAELAEGGSPRGGLRLVAPRTSSSIEVSPVGVLRRSALEALLARDVDGAARSGTLRHDAPSPPTTHEIGS